MKPARITRRWRALRNSLLALACATVITIIGQPVGGVAEAAPAPPKLKPGKRCDEMYGVKNVPTGGMPQGDASRAVDRWDTYDYTNPGLQFDGLNPTQAELDAAGTDYKKYDHSDPRRIYARFNAQRRWTSFGDYLSKVYIPNQGYDARGKAFMGKVVREMGLTGPDWICEKEFYFKDPDTGKQHLRRLDAYNKRTREIVEVKSNGNPDGREKPADRAWAKNQGWRSYKYTYVFAENQTRDAKNFMKELKDTAGKDTLGRDRVRTYDYQSHHKGVPPKGTENGPYRANSTTMSPGNGASTGSRGSGNQVINQSPANPRTLKDQLDRLGKTGERALMNRGLGGIDFTTLDLRYIGKGKGGKGLDYAFSAKSVEDEYAAGWGGQEKGNLISDAFFTWLALDPSTFWVNLNPDEPNRIIDAGFGKTDAGRVLLEADLELKHDIFKAMDPETEAGRNFMNALPQRNGFPCWAGFRYWIEPETAVVREQDGGIHILDTPLKLSTVPQETTTQPPGGKGCDLTEAETQQSDRVLDRYITPLVAEKVNNGDYYADLRRVYTARVAAEWVRQNAADMPAEYRGIINSNDVRRWPLRAPHQNWTGKQVWDRYYKAFTEGTFKYKWSNGEEVYVYTVGGVDFSKQPKSNMNPVRFRAEQRYKPRTVGFAVDTIADDPNKDGYLMFGGNSAGQSETGTPSPTPTPTGTASPTATPSPTGTGKPTPTPTDPGPTATQSPGATTPPGPKDPDGDLADTGSSTPVGLIVGIAAVAIGAGGALVWWRRRRAHTGS
ncbi:LPXTG cell wall anchor domain-containing protein [Streptomyces sp. NPDC058548]|uniref:LPXTG cell wall anchor domain-containing protein n=1 Tax=Streptomyces sp. NPDC058548 TaxID=3346545 RepID=UPI00366A2192